MSAARLVSAGGHLKRYGLAAGGPLASAAAQFVLALVLIARVEPSQFGRFSFLMVLSQFALALWSALFSAPLLVAVASGGPGRADARAILQTSALASGPVALASAVLAYMGEADAGAAAIYALFVALLLARQVARTRALGSGAVTAVARSDSVYALAIFLGAGVFFVRAPQAFGMIFLPLLVGVVLALLPVARLLRAPGPAWTTGKDAGAVLPQSLATGRHPPVGRDTPAGRAPQHWAAGALASLRDYRAVWRRDSRWSVLGVVSTEMTVNSHAYALTMLAGPAAFAPIAAAGLFIRPVSVLVNALNEFERARFARVIHSGQTARLWHERRAFLAVLGMAWACTLGAALCVLFLAPELGSLARYDRSELSIAVMLWFAVVLARCMHTPDGALFQAQGQFRMLAGISIWTAVLSLAGVLAGLFVLGPVWSLLGILAGEGAYALVLVSRGRKATRRLVQNAQQASS